MRNTLRYLAIFLHIYACNLWDFKGAGIAVTVIFAILGALVGGPVLGESAFVGGLYAAGLSTCLYFGVMFARAAIYCKHNYWKFLPVNGGKKTDGSKP